MNFWIQKWMSLIHTLVMKEFVYVEVLWPSQPNGVMSSAVGERVNTGHN